MANGDKFTMVKARRGIPTMRISIAPMKNDSDSILMQLDSINGYYVPGIVENEEYFFEVNIRDTLFDYVTKFSSLGYLDVSGISLTAFAIDNGYIKSVEYNYYKFSRNPVIIEGVERQYYDSYFGITYCSGPKDTVKHSKIALFLNWNRGASTVMKVIELKNQNVH
jgi:hypothetical protein